jgi:phage-related minor tail protein
MSKKDLKVTLIGDDKTGKAFGSAGSGAAKFAKVAAAGLAAVGAAAAATGVALFKIGGEFDKSYDTIRVGTGATGDALGALKDDFRDVVANVPTDFKSASTAIADLNTRTGQTGEPLRQLSKQMLEMTRLTGGDLSANIASVTRVFGDWGVAAKDQSGTMDYLFKVSQTTGIGIDALSQKVVQFGAPLRQMGFDFETSAAMLGKWEKEGVNTEAVLSGMKIGLGKFSAAGKEPVKAMADVTAAIKGAGTAGAANQIAIEAFGQRAGPDMAAAIREGRFDLDALMGTLKGSKETILGAAADTQDFTEKWQMFKNQALLALEPIATRVFTALGGYLDRFSAWWSANGPMVIATATAIGASVTAAFTTAASGVQAAIGIFQQFQPIILAVAGVVTAVFVPHFVAMGVAATVNAAKTVAAWVTTQVAAIKSAVIHSAQIVGMVAKWALLGAQSLLHAAKVAAAWLIAMGPIALVIAAVIGLVVVIVKNWDTIKEKTAALWGWVKTATSAAWTAVKTAFSAGMEAVKTAVTTYFNAYKTIVTTVFTAIKTAISTAWGAVKTAFTTALQAIKTVVATYFNAYRTVVGAVFGAIQGAVSAAWTAVKGVFQRSLGAIGTAVTTGLGKVVGYFAGLPRAITGAVGDLGSLLSRAGGKVISGFIDGITGGFRKVRETLGKLTSMLPDWKGPASRDAMILRNAGQLVMGGFERGLRDEFGLIRRTMNDATDLVGMKVGGTGYVNRRLASTAAAAPVEQVRKFELHMHGTLDAKITEQTLESMLLRMELLNGTP